LRVLNLANNDIEDISPLKQLTRIGELEPSWPMRYQSPFIFHFHPRNSLDLSGNRIKVIKVMVDNSGVGAEDVIDLQRNPLNDESREVHIPVMRQRGAEVLVSGESQESRR
jgi:hypothetical protein